MFSHGFIFLWISYVLVRQTTIPELKRLNMSGVMTRWIIGITCFLLGMRRICLDMKCWMDSIENILFYPIFFMMPILIIVSMIMDFRELPDKNIPSQVIHPITMLRLITWDMWLVTGVGIFLFFYPALSIWFNL